MLRFLLFLFIFMSLIRCCIKFYEEKKLFLNFGFILIGLLICFLLRNYFLFYVRFEFTVIPIFLLIIGWGYRFNRLQAGFYIFLYTLSTSLPFFLFLLVETIKKRINYQYFFICEFREIGAW